ncbi:hypothetical protein DZC75_10020 [Pseudomonas parafulva]|uniref:Uncharacterized protein n=1 Tax=Pseudomonas parafulva TaxID=157782 RepID=A0AAI8KB14_9PSED|nr:hypothetical protein DZC75_10020 [Pseudomonas parafulva]
MRREVTGMDARQALGARTAPKRGPPGATPARGNPCAQRRGRMREQAVFAPLFSKKKRGSP